MAKGIYKRGKVYWIRYARLDGRIVFESSHSKKFADADSLLTDRKKAIREGKEPDAIKIQNHTFRELSECYVKWAERQRCFKSKIHLIRQVTDAFGNLQLRRFNTMLLEQYQTQRLNKGNKPATVNRILATIKHMFTKAVEWEMVEEETLKRVRKVKFLEENNKRLRYLSIEECHTLANISEPHLKPLIITALNTGCRRGEILGLRWEQVDLKHGFILLDKTKNGDRREVPINNTLRQTLQGITRRLDVPYVFFDATTGERYQDVKRSFHTALRKAGIRDFRFHDLRHTFASHLVMAGVDLTTVSRLLGHRTLTMTLRYAHLAPAHMVKALDILDNTINEKPTIQKLYTQALVS